MVCCQKPKEKTLILKDRENWGGVICIENLCQTAKSQSGEGTVQQKCSEKYLGFGAGMYGIKNINRQCFQ